MLVRDDGETWTAIGQPAHAWLAAQLALAWREPLEPDVLLAIAQHDVAWSDWDLAPPRNADARRAASFYETRLDDRVMHWRRVDERLEAQSPYAALLVSMHATNIFTRYGKPENHPTEFLTETRAAQDALSARLEVDRATAERDADLVFGFDAMSLALCLDREDTTVELPGHEPLVIRTTEPGAATVDPWPFTPPELVVAVYARSLSERFDDEPALHRALDAARYHALRWRLTPH